MGLAGRFVGVSNSVCLGTGIIVFVFVMMSRRA